MKMIEETLSKETNMKIARSTFGIGRKQLHALIDEHG